MNFRPFTYRRPRVLVSATIAALLASSAFAAADSVLCFGEDGHVSVETAVAGVCVDGSAGSRSRESQPESVHLDSNAANHCGPCEDVPICHDDAPSIAVRSAPIDNGHDATSGAVPSPASAVNQTDQTYSLRHARDSYRYASPPVMLRSVQLQN